MSYEIPVAGYPDNVGFDDCGSNLFSRLTGSSEYSGPTAEEESDLVPTLTMFGTPSLVSKHRADFQILIEAYLAFFKFGLGRFFVTDDHKFFKLLLMHTSPLKKARKGEGVSFVTFKKPLLERGRIQKCRH